MVKTSESAGETTTKAQERLYHYMHGYWTGARWGSVPPQADEDFCRGHKAGLKASGRAYRDACQQYETELAHAPLARQAVPA